VILKKIKLLNFRSFLGEHVIDVSPGEDGATKPVILFGGLNGAGKTSILLAVKLALYGKLSLGRNIAARKYDEFIEESVHRGKSVIEPLSQCGVGLTFTFDKQGRNVEYEVFRSWNKKRSSFEESISILENGEALKGLSSKENEGFLNQLVPLGVSDLFFFDGEKIAELAEDHNGLALGSAIKKMLGVELIDRLRADLRVFLLSNAAGKSRDSESTLLAKETDAFVCLKERIKSEECQVEELLEAYQVEKARQSDLEMRLVESGGEFAKSRQEQQKLGGSLASQAEGVRREIRDSIADLFPLSLAKSLVQELVQEAEQVIEREKQIEKNKTLSEFGQELKLSIDLFNHAQIDDALARTIEMIPDKPVFYPNVTQSDVDRLNRLATVDLPKTNTGILKKLVVLEKLEEDLESTALSIDRAPDDRSLQEQLAEVVAATKSVESQRAEIVTRSAEIKLLYDKAQDLARNLKRGHEARSKKAQSESAFDVAVRARETLLEFSQERVSRKIDALQDSFVETFDRLMRKRNSICRAEIDPKTFAVELYGLEDQRINKNKMSAGEKQIYAVAMLDALARTSGNHLPIIIDTPLGRLDSEHRNKLVNQYFPSASHQVILLSTDTEIDSHHYADLEKHCARKLHIAFDQDRGCSGVETGYFYSGDSKEVT
jgi:DNA sulfur modification protein DndD